MLDIYRNSRPYVIFLIILTLFIAWVPVYFKPSLFLMSGEFLLSPIFYLITGFYSLSELILVITGFCVWLLIAFAISFINSRHQFIEKRNYLPALFFVLSSAWLPGIQQLNPALLAMVFVIIAIDKIFLSYSKGKVMFSLFDAGLLISIGSLFYLPFASFLVIIWAGIILFRSLNWKNWLNSLFGFITPWAITYGLFFFLKGEIIELNQIVIYTFASKNFTQVFSISQNILFAFIAIFFLISSFYLLQKFQYKNIRSKKYFLLLFWIFIIMIVLFFIIPGNNGLVAIGIAFPLSYLFSHYFSLVKNQMFTNVLFLIYVIGMVVTFYLPLVLE